MGRLRNATLWAAATGALVAGLLATPATAAKAKKDIRSQPFAFAATTLTPPTGSTAKPFSEPSIALSSKDHVYFCGPHGLNTGNGFIRTADWQSFEYFNITDTPAEGEDCDVKVGPDDSVYEADLQIAGSAIRKSVLDGQGPPAPPNTTGNGSFDYQVYEDTVEQDRQWLAPDPTDGSIVYFGYHDLSAELEVVTKSLDGGKTFPIHNVTSNDPTLLPDTAPNTFSGPVRVDPADHNTVVQAYGISTVGDNAAACNPDTLCFGYPKSIIAAVSTDGGLTWSDHIAMSVAGQGDKILGNIFPWVTFDRAGNLYVMADLGGTDANGNRTNGVYYAFSADKGTTWSPMKKVNAGAGAVVFPTMVGGTGGVVDFAWLESSAADQSTTSATWAAHFAQARNAATTNPSISEVTGPTVRTGAICTLGIVCPNDGSRNLGDFFEIALDSFGYAQVAVPAGDQGKAIRDIWWRQDAGPSATSQPCSPTCVTTRPGPRP
jgi:hypothetical protein